MDANLIWQKFYEWDVAGAFIIFLISIASAFVIKYILRFIEWRIAKKTRTTLDDELLHSLETPLFMGITLGGLIAGLFTVHYLDKYHQIMQKVSIVLGILWVTWIVMRVIKALFKWYEKEIAIKTKSDIDDRYLHIIRRGINILIFVIAVLITLAKLGIEITPLLAGLGIGGLAVALALQDSLSNFFSGVYTMTDRSIKIGDYIETDSNIKGIIKDISWRTAKIQQLDGNLVIVPNSKLAQSIVTNYDAIDKSMALVVPVGVSYDSDLDKVERITIKVAKEVLRDKNQLPKNFEPVVRYTQFADFSINFNVILKINDFSQRFTVKHEFIKRLKKEYDKNKIEIPFPIRTIYMKK